ncbi:MAG: O-antigen ligase family protein [Richelia sp. SL_2_1]|nr:O-antigen ligase family protein [Richelia sp. RM1_1_1]NJO30138.1 O-antigen ligase family protein [Richelia sp. SL_2_1]
MIIKISSYSLLLKIKIFLFSTALFGFGLVAMLVTNPTASRLITAPYRAVILLFSIIIIFLGLNFSSEKIKTQKIYTGLTRLSPISLLTLFIIIYSFRLIYDTGYNTTLTKDISEYILTWFGICLLPAISFLFLDIKHSNKYLYFSYLILAIASVAVSSIIFQGQTSRIFIEQGRLGNDILNPISIGHQSASLTLICLERLLIKNRVNSISNQENKNNKLNLLINIIFMIFGVSLVLFAASRSPIIALIICGSLLIVKLQRQGLNILKIISILIFLVLAVNFGLEFVLNSGSSLLERFASTLNGDEFYDSRFIQRPELYQRAIQLIGENLGTGHGLEIPYVGYPHNLIIEAFLSTGVLGGFIFVILYVYALIKSITLIFNKKSSWGWLGILYIQYAIGAMFSGSLYGYYTFWYLLFAIIGLKEKIQSNHAKYCID